MATGSARDRSIHDSDGDVGTFCDVWQDGNIFYDDHNRVPEVANFLLLLRVCLVNFGQEFLLQSIVFHVINFDRNFVN